jgi:hypothetical protein
MRVSITNCVSTAEKMMRFSDESLFKNAGTDDFDYVVVTWLPSPEVWEYLKVLPNIAMRLCGPRCKVHVLEHTTDESIGYVPNLRAMISESLNYGFMLNDYCGLTNTDVVHAPGWLGGLVKHVAPNRVINSLHITAVPAHVMEHRVAGIINEDLGVPEPETFNMKRFEELYQQHYADVMVTSKDIGGKGGYRQCATMPWIMPRAAWIKCGPWENTLAGDPARAPDRRFFDRVDAAGFEFALSYSSVVYHHEAVERRRTRPAGAEHLSEE